MHISVILKSPRLWTTVHRWLGLFSCLGLVLWALSGITHPVMTRIQPVPKVFSPPMTPYALREALSLQEVLGKQQITGFTHVSLAYFDQTAYYRVAAYPTEAARYFRLSDGEERTDGDRAYAMTLACHYTGLDKSQITSIERLTQFEDDYHPVNRLLPVWRVAFSTPDGLRAFVDTEQSRLSTLVDDQRDLLTQIFAFGHNWSFLPSGSWLQLWLSTLFLGLIVISACSGLYLLVKKRSTAKHRIPRFSTHWWHRKLAIPIAFFSLIMAGSGLFHLHMSHIQQQMPVPVVNTTVQEIDPTLWANLQASPILKLDIYGIADHVIWQHVPATMGQHLPEAQVAAHAHHATPHKSVLPELWMTSKQGIQQVDPVAFGRAWMHTVFAIPAERLPEQGAEWITQFGPRYGFIFKRLPVIMMTTRSPANQYFIEPSTGALAAQMDSRDRLEGMVFAYLHKWNLPLWGGTTRDLFAVTVAFMVLLTGLLGMWMFLFKPMKH